MHLYVVEEISWDSKEKKRKRLSTLDNLLLYTTHQPKFVKKGQNHGAITEAEFKSINSDP